MAGGPDRRAKDLQRAKALAARSTGLLSLGRLDGSPIARVSLRLRIPTARNDAFPRERQEVSEVVLQLPPRYPFEKPIVSFRTPIWNPNVFIGGLLCYGTWKVMEYLDLFLLRVMKVVALDPSIVNPSSPANPGAADWYRALLRARPALFPTVALDQLIRPERPVAIAWRTLR